MDRKHGVIGVVGTLAAEAVAVVVSSTLLFAFILSQFEGAGRISYSLDVLSVATTMCVTVVLVDRLVAEAICYKYGLTPMRHQLDRLDMRLRGQSVVE